MAFRGFLFTVCAAPHTEPVTKLCNQLIFLQLTSICDCHYCVTFLFVPNGLNKTLRHKECGAGEGHVERQKKEDGKGPRCTKCTGRMGLEALFSDQHMCVFV